MMVMGRKPDPMCVFTYVQSLYNHLRKFEWAILLSVRLFLFRNCPKCYTALCWTGCDSTTPYDDRERWKIRRNTCVICSCLICLMFCGYALPRKAQTANLFPFCVTVSDISVQGKLEVLCVNVFFTKGKKNLKELNITCKDARLQQHDTFFKTQT